MSRAEDVVAPVPSSDLGHARIRFTAATMLFKTVSISNGNRHRSCIKKQTSRHLHEGIVHGDDKDFPRVLELGRVEVSGHVVL